MLHQNDKPKGRCRVAWVAQYAVNGIDKPIGVAEYHLLQGLPDNLAQNLPSIDQIEAGLLGDWPIE
jgi:hypothetical protein